MDTTTPTGWIIQSRLPVLGDDWEICRMHGATPPEGFTELRASRIAASLVKMTGSSGPEMQWRILDPKGKEVARESSRNPSRIRKTIKQRAPQL